MGKDSALYQLMGMRMNGVMNGITNSDGEYQAFIRKSDEYSGRLEKMELVGRAYFICFLLLFHYFLQQ